MDILGRRVGAGETTAREEFLVIDKGALVAGRYRLLEQIGSGAMGVVWKAHDERLARTVAIKRLLVRYGLTDSQSEETRRRAMREARIAARLQHRNAIAMFDVAEHDGDPCLVMEFLPSRSLSVVLAERGSLPPNEVAEIGAQVAAALAAAHAVGIVHRDVKPGNILLADNGTVKITDFGISKALDDGTVTTQTGIAGTPAYLAPEVARGEDPTRASDVFSLGSTLYHAVEGRPPFGTNSNPLALLHAVASGNAPPPRNAGPLADTLATLMRPDPVSRPTMQEAATALASPAAAATPAPARPTVVLGQSGPPTPPRPVPMPPQPVPAAGPPGQPPTASPAGSGAGRSQQTVVLAALAGLAVLAIVVIGVVMVNSGSEQTAGNGGGATSSRTATSTPTPSSTSSSPPPATSITPIPANQPIDYSAAGRLVIDYYGNFGNPALRWSMLSTNAKALFGDQAAFQQYWSAYTGLSSRNARGVTENPDGSVNVPVDVTYTNASGPVEKHLELRVTWENNRLVIDSEAR